MIINKSDTQVFEFKSFKLFTSTQGRKVIPRTESYYHEETQSTCYASPGNRTRNPFITDEVLQTLIFKDKVDKLGCR
jgi:hypothetical protein